MIFKFYGDLKHRQVWLERCSRWFNIPVLISRNNSGRTILFRTNKFGYSKTTTLVSSGKHDFYNPLKDHTQFKSEKNILLVGDGDLSNGALISNGFKENRPNCNLIASVLESELQHNNVYQNSRRNIDIIRNNGHEIKFEVDATRLSDYFNKVPDRIQFNFPHWRGKTNNRRNRKLISDFMASSQSVLSSGGQVHLALMDHQGGMHSKTIQEWKCSWLPALYAAENGMLLSHVKPFQPEYNLSSYQFRDRPFHVLGGGKESFMNIFTKVGDEFEAHHEKVPKDIQMCSHFTLFITLPNSLGRQNYDGSDETNSSAVPVSRNNEGMWTNKDILDETFISDLIQSKIPPGIRTEIQMWKVLRGDTSDSGGDWGVIEYKVFFFGERQPITLKDAEAFKTLIEDEVQKFARGTRRGGWKASNVIPSSILQARGWGS